MFLIPCHADKPLINTKSCTIDFSHKFESLDGKLDRELS